MAIKNKIFLAHASEDKLAVRKLHADLKERGFDPWLDEIDLLPGQIWRNEIPKVIREAVIFLACLSSQSVEKIGYIQNEFRIALSAFGERPHDLIYLIPVRLDDCAIPDIPIPNSDLTLRDIVWVDLFEPYGFDQLVKSLENSRKAGPASKPKTAHAPPSARSSDSSKDQDPPWVPEMVTIPSGNFLMGSPESEAERQSDEVQHVVMLSKPFLLGRHAVTFDEYDHFCEATGREKPDDQGWGRGRRPVVKVSWDDAIAYCDWLSELTSRRYHLPSEAQWEYACRAGTQKPFSFGASITTDESNYDGNYPYAGYAGAAKGEYRKQTVSVGSLPKNPWGMHEMHGNVWEWCADWYGTYPLKTVTTDPQGPTTGTKRVLRGGSWRNPARSVRAACRFARATGDQLSDVGFRCAGVQES